MLNIKTKLWFKQRQICEHKVVCPRLRDSLFFTQFFNIPISLFVRVCCTSSPLCICVIACLCRFF